MQEANRRRTIQLAYNEKHGITPQTTVREITDIRPDGRKATQVLLEEISLSDSVTSLPQKLAALEKQMQEAADRLEFELAAVIRDQIEELKNAA